MKLLLDTNIILDMLLGRGPWLAAASAIWQASLEGRSTSFVTARSPIGWSALTAGTRQRYDVRVRTGD